MKKIFAMILICIFVACDKVELKPKTEVSRVAPISLNKDVYILDGKGGLFKNVKWYEYSMENHIIWPLFDVYIIKTQNDIYKIQIMSYFGDGDEAAGTYKMQVASQKNQENKTIKIDGSACGNPYTNPDYNNCIDDPNQNVYAYLKLSSLVFQKMTESDALESYDWDIAFRGTDIKLNSGKSGPGVVVGALAKRFDFFFDADTNRPNMAALRNVELKNKALEAFKNISLNIPYNYYLRDGIDRVIYEGDWYRENSDLRREARNDYWWIVREYGQNSYAKINISDIRDVIDEDNFSTNIEISYKRQDAKDETFNEEVKKIQFEFSHKNKTLSECFNFKNAEVFICDKGRTDWDLKLTVVNIKRGDVWVRDWRIFTNKGARGPFVKDEIDRITSGK